jgi:acetyl esterase
MLWNILILLALLVYVYIQYIRKTSFGLLDTRVAIALKIMPQRDGPLTPDQMRQELKKTVAKFESRTSIKRVENKTLEIKGRRIPARIYSDHEGASLPVFIFYHGGGWVCGDLDTHDGICRQIAQNIKTLIVSVDYRLAPEHPYPSSLEDAYDALVWISQHGETIGGDHSTIIIGGDSAGGNLAAAVALKARNENGPKIKAQLLIYPVTQLNSLDTESYIDFKEGYFLTKHKMETYINHYVPDEQMRTEAYVSPIMAKDLSGLPPTLILTAGFDPLRDEGEAYGKNLIEAGVSTTIIRYKGTIHGFFGISALGKSSKKAMSDLKDFIENIF